MNFRIIAHLVRSDWQRLKRPLIALWIILIITALPWLLHRPGNFQSPMWAPHGRDSRLGPVPEDFNNYPWNSNLIHSLEMLATVLALILAAMLGAQWVKHPLTPVRGRARLAALALSLLVFLVLPQWIPAFGNLLLQGFSPGIAALAAASPALSAWMLLGLAAALGVWLPSPWLFLAGCAALASSVGFVSELGPPPIYQFGAYPTLLLLPAGLKEWLFGSLAIALLTLSFLFFRRRLNGPWKVAIAVLLVLIARIPAMLLPPPELDAKNDPAIPIGAIRPLLEYVSTTWVNDSNSPNLQLSARMNSTGCPPGCDVRFVPAAGWIIQDGVRVAELLADAENHPTLRDPDGYFLSPGFGERNAIAALAALPGTGKPLSPDARRNTGFVQLESLGTFALAPGATVRSDRSAELHMEFTAIVYRFEKVWDVPLRDEVTKFREGNLIWRIRRNSSQKGEPRADLLLTHPALGLSDDPDEARWNTPIIFHSELYFHLPATGANVRAADPLMSSSGPLFSGAGWDRAILAPSHAFGEPADLTGLRLLRLKPVLLARFTTSSVTRFRPSMSDYPKDFDLNYRDSVHDASYRRDLFPKRPDPLTCTREEFARWLRTASHVYPGPSGSQHDLAAFAPRFAGLMAKVGDHESVAAALRLGTPVAMQDEVIDAIDPLEDSNRLAEVAMDRGWLNEARGSILRRFDDGGIWEIEPVMALEEPSTYPKLISRFLEKPERETYEKLRLLPGIEPMLGEEIAKAVREISPEFLKASLPSYQNSAPYGPFLYAAKRGDAEAFATVLDLYIASSDKGAYAPFRDLTYVLSAPELKGMRYDAIADWLSAKSADSFRFDPLLRLWKSLP